LATVLASALGDVGRSLREGFFMFWETLWPLIFGFTLSGAVQAFVSREQMQRVMGNHGPGAVARAAGFGTISSSCSYAATAMAKSLFQKGADFTTAMIFMFASTNLVVELGVVLVVLIGWQFAAAEFVGGAIMIVLLAVTGWLVVGRRRVDETRRHLQATGSGADDHQAMAGVSEERQVELESEPWHVKLRSRAAWADAASYTTADLTMLRRELVIGYVVAGFLTVLVPTHVWNVVFLHGQGFWTTLENVVVGPFIAVISFVCSIGNVPLAATLWHGGISFGGVVAFIFADLITLPLLLIYRKYYGGRLTLRLLVWFWAVMAVAGLIVEGLFSVAGLIPHTQSRPIVATAFHWNYTTFLNIIFLLLAGYLYWLYRNRTRLGGGPGYAIDPVCGMQVQATNAPAHRRHDGQDYVFCSDRCAERFDATPQPYTKSRSALEGFRSRTGLLRNRR
jgi:uncharacterized membrane protein YraQ (UPF0718 family)/YHS domain-containing protein